jgi:hypothetical protein
MAPVLTDSILNQRYFNLDYYRLFMPLTYYYSPIASISRLNWQFKPVDSTPFYDKNYVMYDTIPFSKASYDKRLVDRALLSAYAKDVRLVRADENEIMSRKIIQELPPTASKSRGISELFKAEPVEDNFGKPRLKVYKPNWWTHGGSFSIQTTQNYVSDNWYQGGENTNTLLAYLAFKANYNDREKVQFDNLFEARLGVTSSPSDTCHKFLVNNDLLRITSKLGIQASKHWYYTISGEFNTQSFNAYQKNTNTLLACFLSPANLIFSVGMDYKIKNKKLDFSLLLSPIAYNLRYVGDKDVDETRYGLKEGKKFLQIYGSKLTSTWTWQLSSTFSWKSRLYYFTNYDHVEAEWENTFDYRLNKYLSSQLFLHGRYDDGTTPKSGHSYFQLKEYFSFGLKYDW